MYTRDKEYYSLLTLEKAEACVKQIRKDDHEWKYMVVPTERTGYYKVAVFDETSELLGYL